MSQRRLGALGKGLLALGAVATVALGVVTGLAVHRRRLERMQAAKALDSIAEARRSDRMRGTCGVVVWGPLVYNRLQPKPPPMYFACTPVVVCNEKTAPLDPWGNPFRFAQPGPVHKRGWDAWSCGPNGIDEHGGGDDILVGEDVADVSSQ